MSVEDMTAPDEACLPFDEHAPIVQTLKAEAVTVLGRNIPTWLFTEDMQQKTTVLTIDGIVDLIAPLLEAAWAAGRHEGRQLAEKVTAHRTDLIEKSRAALDGNTISPRMIRSVIDELEVAAGLPTVAASATPLENAIARFEDAVLSDRRHSTFQSSEHLKRSKKKLKRALAKHSESLVAAEKDAAMIAVAEADTELILKASECAGYYSELRAAEQKLIRLERKLAVTGLSPEAQASRAESIAMLRKWEQSLRIPGRSPVAWLSHEPHSVARRVAHDDISAGALAHSLSVYEAFEADLDRSSRVRGRVGKNPAPKTYAEAVEAAGPGRAPRRPKRPSDKKWD